MRADLQGRAEVFERVGLLEFAEGDEQRMDLFPKAVQTLRYKVGLDEPHAWKQLVDKYKGMADGIARRQMTYLKEGVDYSLKTALEEGMTLDGFKKNVGGLFDAMGITPRNSYHIENIFRSNLQMAYGAGKEAAFTDPDVEPEIVAYQYIAIKDLRTRPEHAKMHMLVFGKDDPIWEEWTPPNGYGCRCDKEAIFTGDPEAEGFEPSKMPPNVKPDPGWNMNPLTGKWPSATYTGQPMKKKMAAPVKAKPKKKEPVAKKPKKETITAAPKPKRRASKTKEYYGLTLDERVSIGGYTGYNYGKIKAVQEGKDYWIEGQQVRHLTDLQKKAARTQGKKIEKALKKVPPMEGTVYRGLKFTLETGMQDLERQIQTAEFWESMVPGKVAEFKSLSSATIHKGTAESFATSSGENAVLLRIKSKTGRPIWDIPVASQFKGEREVLFGKGSKFVVKSISKTGKAKSGHPYKIVELVEFTTQTPQ